MSNFKRKEWESAYDNKGNFVFYPHEEVIRFTSKYIKKRVGISEYTKVSNAETSLDLGCGIGRHVIYLNEIGLESYGIDLSENAVKFAREWCESLNKHELAKNITVGSIDMLPYQESFFDVVVSHGVLDSMPFEVAQYGIKETHRVMKSGGLFYLDLVSGDDSKHPREYDGEEEVSIDHERGTIQSYFNWSKINRLIGTYFEVVEAFLIQRESVIGLTKNSRYHIVLKKI